MRKRTIWSFGQRDYARAIGGCPELPDGLEDNLFGRCLEAIHDGRMPIVSA